MRAHELLEAYYLLETPQRLEFLVKTFGPKIEARAAHDHIPPDIIAAMSGEVHDNNEDGAEPAPLSLATKIINYISTFDPTPNKQYTQWLVSRYVKRGPSPAGTMAPGDFLMRLEDYNPAVTQTLEVFSRVSRSGRIERRNIDQYRDLIDLEDVVNPFIEGRREVSGRMDRKTGRNTAEEVAYGPSDPIRQTNQCTVLLDTPELFVAIPLTPEAASHFGENTRWCTTSGNGGMFNHYSSKAPLYFICDRIHNRRWQFHIQSSQYMDEQDRQIDLKEFAKTYRPALDAIGIEKFIPAANRLGLRFFPKATFVGDDVTAFQLANVITSLADLKYLTKKALRKPDLLRSLADKFLRTTEQGAFLQMLQYFMEASGLDDDYYMDAALKFPSLFEHLPERFRTDENKYKMLGSVPNFSRIEQYIPKPWPQNVQDTYWMLRAQNDYNVRANDIPDRYRKNLAMMTYVLAKDPEAIPQYSELMSQKMVDSIVAVVAQNSQLSGNLPYIFANIPTEYLSKNSAKDLTAAASEYKDDKDIRDDYLAAIANFPADLWPKPPTVFRRVALTSKLPWNKLPKIFHTSEFATEWANYSAENLSRIPVQFITEDTAYEAMHEVQIIPPRYGDKRSHKNHLFHTINLKYLPNGVPAEIIVGALKRLGIDRLSKEYLTGLPAHVMTPEVRQALGSFGVLQYGDVPKITPKVVINRSKHTFEKSQIINAKHIWDGGKLKEISPTVSREQQLENTWKEIPEQAITKELLVGVLPKYPNFIDVAPDRVLDKDVMVAWAGAVPKRYNAHKPDIVRMNRFPKDQWTEEAMGLLVKAGVINDIPEEFQGSTALSQALGKSDKPKNFPWGRITKDVVLQAIKRAITPDREHGYVSGFDLKYIFDGMPKNLPALKDEEVAYAALKEYNFGMYHRDVVKKLYADPAMRVNWSQRCYDEAAGWCIALKDIPAEFRTEATEHAAGSRDVQEIRNIPNFIARLNAGSIEVSDLDLAKQGIVKVSGQYHDALEMKRTEVEGKGSYIALMTDKMASGGWHSSPQPALALYLFDSSGKLYDGIIFQSSNEARMFSDKPLWKYRLVIADALEKTSKVPLSHNGHLLPSLWIYQDRNGRPLPVERMVRQDIGGTSLKYVPISQGWGNKRRFIFNARGKLLVALVVDHNGKFETASIRAPIPEAMESSKELAIAMGELGFPSGSGPKFKESPLYQALGVRGTGTYQWFSLLDEKIGEVGDLTVWRAGSKITITDNTLGVINAGGKLFKDGTYGGGEPRTDKDAEGKQIGSAVWKRIDDAKSEIAAIVKKSGQ